MSATEPPPAATNGNANCAPDEEQPLLGQRKPPSPSVLAKFRRTMTAEVCRDWADLVLLLCYVVTGLLDSSSTKVWGAFVSMQTGLFLHPKASSGHIANIDNREHGLCRTWNRVDL